MRVTRLPVNESPLRNHPQEKERYLPYPQVGARPTIRVSPGSSLFCIAALFLEGAALWRPSRLHHRGRSLAGEVSGSVQNGFALHVEKREERLEPVL